LSSIGEKTKEGVITRIAEKNNISNLTCAGVYIFSQSKDIVKALERQLSDKTRINGEYYFTPCLNYLIDEDYEVYPLPVKSFYDLGDIKNIEYFSHTPLAESFSKTMPKGT